MRHRNVISLVLLFALAPVSAWAATVEGQVTTEGVGIPGASVFLGDREVRTDNDGRYTMLDAPAGPETLVVLAEGFRTETRPVDVPASGTLTGNLELVPDLALGPCASTSSGAIIASYESKSLP